VSPWIIYPKEVIFEASVDGKNYKEVARQKNTVSNNDYKVMVQELGADVNINTRFIRVRAVSGGPLPGGHESAGSPSHLFIDEIIVK
jgi:hypothetical protein